ncbi:Ankyrin repeat protein, putative [Hondaea fermentalgiana]|uniref:Ankyrin repeat protein, putative n=1 Tax=Hondaea fermentalgiana TaxID=2315210 RepID=A0A2R5GL90_9STRA|nr:Ankyrin repeat protein, putative [Hondaea fermentalgiana]|eukprot:GBG31069.1 Ankyrin repeat protein, putative [Hondaea fermentalgiana]
MEAAAASLTAGLSAGLGPSASMPPTENENLMNSNETEVFVDLLDAAVEGNLGRVKSLLKIMDAGAASRLDFRRSQPTFGESPLHRAASVEVAKALVDHGVNVDLQGAVGQTPLHTLVSAPHVDCAETVQILLRAGAKIDHQNDSGNAALHMVCSLDVARLLHARSASMASSWSDDGVTNLVQARTDEFYFRFFEVMLLRLTVSTHIDVTLFRDASNLVSAVGAVLLWIRLLSFAEGFEVIGITMCTIRRMLADIAIYLVVLLIYVTGFSHAITLIFRGSGSQLYGTMYNSWITLYFFVFNLDVGALNDEEKVFRKYSGYFFVGIYMVVVALVILNLIIAIMTNTFDEIQQNAKEQWLLQRARIILTYDLREKSLNKMYKMLCLRCRRCCGRTSDAYDVEDYLPELTRKNIVIEKGNGQVDVQVPAEWLHAVNLIRRKAPTYNSIRYTLFRRWKKLRRSPSFLWPELKETQSFFQEVEADEQRIAQQALNNEALHRRSTSICKSEADSDTEGLDDGEDSVESEDLAAFNGVYPGNAVRREESAGLLHGQSSQQRGWGTFESEPRQKGLAPKAASVSASSYVSAESSVANNMKRRASSETSAMRTGVEEELVRIGYFQRNPKRIAADRVMQSAIHLQRAAPPPPYAAADLSSVSSRQDMQEDEHEFEASPPAPGSAVGGVSGLGGPGEHAFADGNSVGESTRYSSSAATGVRRRAKSFKRHTSTLEGQIQQEVDDMNDAMALHGVVPGQASVMDDTMNLRNEAAIEHLTGLVVRLSEQVSALEGRIAAQQKADSPHSVSGSEH